MLETPAFFGRALFKQRMKGDSRFYYVVKFGGGAFVLLSSLVLLFVLSIGGDWEGGREGELGLE